MVISSVILGGFLGGIFSGVIGVYLARKILNENYRLNCEKEKFLDMLNFIAVRECLVISYSLRNGEITDVYTAKPKTQRDAKTGKYVKKVGYLVEIL